MALGRLFRLIAAALAAACLAGAATAAPFTVRDQQRLVLNFDVAAQLPSGPFDLFIEMEAMPQEPGDLFGWQLCTERDGGGCTFPQLRFGHPGTERTYHLVASVSATDSDGEVDGVFSLVLTGLSGTTDVRVRAVVSGDGQNRYLEPVPGALPVPAGEGAQVR
jgi:hypothetical protein